jgi:hypothetical protein
MPLPQGNLPAARAFASYTSGTVRLAPRGWFVVVWLVIAVVAGMGLFALFDPGSIRVVVTAGL